MLGQKLVIDAVIKIIKKTFKFDKVLEYVEKPNELDEEIMMNALEFGHDYIKQIIDLQMELKKFLALIIRFN